MFWLESNNKMLCNKTLGRWKILQDFGKQINTVTHLQYVDGIFRMAVHPCCVHCSVCAGRQCEIWLWILLWRNATCLRLVKVWSFPSVNVLSWLKSGLCKENKDSAIVSDHESCKQTSWTNKWQADVSLQAQRTTAITGVGKNRVILETEPFFTG